MIHKASTAVRWTFCLIVVGAAASWGCRAGHSGNAYSGSKLNSNTLLCRSDETAAAGFWRNLSTGVVEKTATVSKEKRATAWRITLKQSRAEVTSFSGASEGISEPGVFDVEFTPSRGLLLISSSRKRGENPEVITIDTSNSSFVYTSQHVNQLWNRANVFYGSCDPA